jgi:16S rRNA (cytosine1402-N4)-methyltransferase
VGLAGHAEALLESAPEDAVLIALDVDVSNLTAAKERLAKFSGRVRTFQANFSELPAVLKEADLDSADAILADLGLSSAQLDDPSRGFSFSTDGPLDMRMDDRLETTAADLVNRLNEKDLADLIYTNGQERYSRRIANAIVEIRKSGRIGTTGQLAQIVEASYPPATRKTRRGVHPATRTFQALRIAVNDELDNLQRLLDVLMNVLSAGGRAAIISYHSLEDRRVKRKFADYEWDGIAKRLTRKPLTASGEEINRNPRSRSGKLRVIEKL